MYRFRYTHNINMCTIFGILLATCINLTLQWDVFFKCVYLENWIVYFSEQWVYRGVLIICLKSVFKSRMESADLAVSNRRIHALFRRLELSQKPSESVSGRVVA